MDSLARRPERVMLGSVFIGVALVLGKLVVGLLTGSLGILSEAVHSLFDLAASTFNRDYPAHITHPQPPFQFLKASDIIFLGWEIRRSGIDVDQFVTTDR